MNVFSWISITLKEGLNQWIIEELNAEMEPSMSPSWNGSTYWPNGGFRKRKAAVTDLDDKINPKMFVTEEKMVKDMQTLSLELAALNGHQNTPVNVSSPAVEEDPFIDLEDDLPESTEPHLEIHQLLKDTLKNEDLHDCFLTKLCENERRRLAMQIVPYIPVHPAQLTTDSISIGKSTTDEEEEKSQDTNDDHLFKIPSVPTPYTVEEPSDNTIHRGSTMKRSFSQADQANSNFSVTELKPDGEDYSSIHHSQSPYFIIEPTTNTLIQTPSSGGASLRISEYLDDPTATTEFTSIIDDDDIDMQSTASSDTGDKMDDD